MKTSSKTRRDADYDSPVSRSRTAPRKATAPDQPCTGCEIVLRLRPVPGSERPGNNSAGSRRRAGAAIIFIRCSPTVRFSVENSITMMQPIPTAVAEIPSAPGCGRPLKPKVRWCLGTHQATESASDPERRVNLDVDSSVPESEDNESSLRFELRRRIANVPARPASGASASGHHTRLASFS